MGCLCSTASKKTEYAKTKANFKDLYNTYNIDKTRLGKGSFGRVYQATGVRGAAIKIYRRSDDESLAAFRAEVWNLMRLRGAASCLQLIDFSKDEDFGDR